MPRKSAIDQPDLFAPPPEQVDAKRWGNFEMHHIEQFRKNLWATVAMLRAAKESPWPDPTRDMSEQVCFHGQARHWFEEEEALQIRRAFATERLRLKPLHFWPLFIHEVAPDVWEEVRRTLGPEDLEDEPDGP